MMLTTLLMATFLDLPSAGSVMAARETQSRANSVEDTPARLADVPAVRAWAAKTGWGGNTVDDLRFGDNEVVVTRRSFTSGVETCGLTVFIPVEGAWEPALTLRKVFGYWLDVAQDHDTVRIVNSRSRAEVARFSITQVQANRPLQTDGRVGRVAPSPARR